MINSEFTEFVESIRNSIQADGADLEVTRVADGVAYFKYTIQPGACRECLLPPQYLSDLLTRNVRQTASEVQEVKIDVEDKDGGTTPLGGACPL